MRPCDKQYFTLIFRKVQEYVVEIVENQQNNEQAQTQCFGLGKTCFLLVFFCSTLCKSAKPKSILREDINMVSKSQRK